MFFSVQWTLFLIKSICVILCLGWLGRCFFGWGKKGWFMKVGSCVWNDRCGSCRLLRRKCQISEVAVWSLKYEKKTSETTIFSMFFRNIFGLNPPKPRMQSSQRFRFSSGFPILKMECQPGGDWNPAWGVVPRNITRTISSQCCVGDSSSWLIYGGFLKWWYPKMDGL